MTVERLDKLDSLTMLDTLHSLRSWENNNCNTNFAGTELMYHHCSLEILSSCLTCPTCLSCLTCPTCLKSYNHTAISIFDINNNIMPTHTCHKPKRRTAGTCTSQDRLEPCAAEVSGGEGARVILEPPRGVADNARCTGCRMAGSSCWCSSATAGTTTILGRGAGGVTDPERDFGASSCP